MAETRIAQIIKKLEDVGNQKDADALKRVADGDLKESYHGIKLAAPFGDETDFIPSHNKVRYLQQRNQSGDELSANEKQFIRSKSPVGPIPAKIDKRSNIGKLQADPRWNPGQFEDEMLHGVSYRDKGTLDRVKSPGAMREQMKVRGWPPAGVRLENGIVTDYVPHHPQGQPEIYDPESGADVGFIEDGSNELEYKDIEEFGEDIKKELQGLWDEGRDLYGDAVQTDLDALNKNRDAFMSQYAMLKENFVTQSPGIICGNAGNCFDAPVDKEHKNLASTIKNRIEQVINYVKGINSTAESNAPYAEKQVEYFNKFQNDIVSAKDIAEGNPKLWLKKLLLVYGNDMNLVVDNPLGFNYDNPLIKQSGFVDNILTPYREMSRRAPSDKEKETPSVTWETLFDRDYPRIDVQGSEAAKERKIIRDVDIWDELASLNTNKSAMESQRTPMLISYESELDYLVQLLAGLQTVLDVQGMIGSQDDSFVIPLLDRAVMSFFRTLTRHYNSFDIVTSGGKLSGKYAVGNASKMEIYKKCLYVAKAYYEWREAHGGGAAGLEDYPASWITDANRPDELKFDKYNKETTQMRDNIRTRTQQFDRDNDMLAPESNHTYKLLKYAKMLDEKGYSEIADRIEKLCV